MSSKALYSAAVSKEMDKRLFEIGKMLVNSGAISTKDDKPTRYSITRFALDLLDKSYSRMKDNDGGE